MQSINDLGVGAEGVLGLARWRLAPKEQLNGAPGVHQSMSLAATFTVILVWMLLALGAGAWRPVTRDA